jgi:hypothetical protein
MLQLVTLSTPYFIVFFFIFVSIINSNIKGFIYLIGLIFEPCLPLIMLWQCTQKPF